MFHYKILHSTNKYALLLIGWITFLPSELLYFFVPYIQTDTGGGEYDIFVPSCSTGLKSEACGSHLSNS